MKITIHKGLNQIGGCITEIQSLSSTEILIDFEHNLPIHIKSKIYSDSVFSIA